MNFEKCSSSFCFWLWMQIISLFFFIILKSSSETEYVACGTIDDFVEHFFNLKAEL